VGKQVKPFTDSEVRKVLATPKRQRIAVSLRLYLEVEPESKGGGKSFSVQYRYPANSYPKYFRLGSYKKISLKQARNRQREFEEWMQNNPDTSPQERKRQEKIAKYSITQEPTLQDLVDAYFSNSSLAKSTLDNEKNYAKNILKTISGDFKIKQLGWDKKIQGKTGRERVVEHIDEIIGRGSGEQAKKVEGFIHKIFEYAIVDKGWLARGQNPAYRKGRVVTKKKKINHHPFLAWKDLPELFNALEQNPKQINDIFLYSIKFLILHPLRVGSLVELKWDYLNQKDEGWIHVPAEVMKSGDDFEVPITPHIQDLLDELEKRRINEWLFPSFRNRKHLHAEAPQKTLIRMGFKGRQDAHGFRSTMMTNGTERMGFEETLMKRCLGQKVGDEITRAYSRGKFLAQRMEFITAWGDELLDNGLKI